jgi:hypothetical protein
VDVISRVQGAVQLTRGGLRAHLRSCSFFRRICDQTNKDAGDGKSQVLEHPNAPCRPARTRGVKWCKVLVLFIANNCRHN